MTTDLFDVSQGTVVTAFSPQVSTSDPRSALVYVNINFVEPLNTIFSDGFGTASVPEPTGGVMLATGGLGMLGFGWRRRRADRV